LKIIIIGGGPAGYIAAIRAAQLGAEVDLIEKNHLGGTCLNYGCIPTKSLFYDSSEYINTKKQINQNIFSGNISLNFNEVIKRKDNVVNSLVTGTEKLINSNKINLIYGNATFIDNNTVNINSKDGTTLSLTGDAFIIASGSKVFMPPIDGIDSEGLLTSKEILSLSDLPKSLTVIGGGVIGLEFASIFCSFGVDVKLVELNKCLSNTDSETTKRLTSMLKKQGLKIYQKYKTNKIEKNTQTYSISIENKKESIVLESEKVLIAAGRIPDFNDLHLENTSIEYDKKILTNSNYQTNISNIYAVGDVNGECLLAHAASHQAISAVEHLLLNKKVSKTYVPSCIFTNPEYCSVGQTEDYLKENKISYIKSKFPFTANGKALTMNSTDGYIKILSSEKVELLGVHILGPHASDLIHEATLAISNNLSIESIISTIHAHPTLSEAFHEAALDSIGTSLHLVPQKK